MNQKKINRRKFLVKSIQCAAGLGVLVSCDKRNPVGPDERLPSAPVGLVNDFDIENNAIKDVILSWNPHNLTDVSGAPLTTINPNVQIVGYNLYRTDTSTRPNVTSAQPINGSSLITGTAFTDAGSIAVGDSYYYWLEVIDSDNNNTSPLSAPLQVTIMAPSPVYVAQNMNAVNTETLELNQAEVKKAVDAAVIAVAQGLTQATPSNVGNAYESILAGVTAQSLIGIKINTLAAQTKFTSNWFGNGLCTHKEVVTAVIEGLVTMLGNTFPANNIIVFDDRYNGPGGSMQHMVNAGFPLKNDGVSYRIASVNYNTTLHGIPVNEAEPSSLLWAGMYPISGMPIRQSSLIQALDYIINVPVIKPHDDAGITFSLKNFFGSIDNPGSLHNGSLAPEMCGTEIPTVYQLTGKKVKLTVGDGFLGAYRMGPVTAPDADFTPCQVIAGTDPVATDAYVLKLINAMRNKTTNLAAYSFSSSGMARHILTAANMGLGSIIPNVGNVQV